jgi:hypothetical protein
MDYLLLAAIIAVPILLIGLVWAGVRTGTVNKDQRVWLDYGNFFIVAAGISAVLIGLLIILLILDRFTDTTQALGFLTALFGVITGLVGTYFGVKQSADAREGAENLASAAAGAGSTAPTITIHPPTATANVSQPHEVTATVTSVDGSRAANVAVTFTVTDGPDLNTTGTETTNEVGQTPVFRITNNGTAGTDTIEAAALGGKGTATVEFRAA